jgi:NADPH:quinone reductase-like Zn-dependent oxidoreductase
MRAAIRTSFFGTTIAFTKEQPHPLPDGMCRTTELKPNEMLIKVKSAAINPIDYKLPRFIGGKGVGLDLSGVVEQVGKGATDFRVGDDVFGRAGGSSGSLADYAIVSQDRVAKKPEWLSFDEAAAIGTAYLTGVHAFKLGNVKEGSSVLIIGASGGTGLAGIQLAVAMKARVVGICSGKNFDFVREKSGIEKMGNKLELVDYTDEKAMSEFKEKNVGTFDCIYDTATGSGQGENYVSSMTKLLKDESGEYVQINGGASTMMRYLTGTMKPHRHFFLTSDEDNQTDLVEIARLLKSTDVKPHIEVKPFDAMNVAEGFEQLKGRRTKGKIVFNME